MALGNIDQSYGVDPNGPSSLEENDEAVTIRVPHNNLNFSDDVISRLQRSVDQLAESSNHGIEQALSILSQEI